MSPDSRVPENSRAILIGVSSYQDTAAYPSYPAVANSLHGMFGVLTDPGLCGWPEDCVELILNPTNAGQLITRLRVWVPNRSSTSCGLGIHVSAHRVGRGVGGAGRAVTRAVGVA